MKNLKQALTKRMSLNLRLSLGLLISLVLISSFKLNALTFQVGLKQRSLSVTQAKVRQIYTSQIGIREKQSNSGPAVEQYLRYVNLSKGNPWCAAFVCWVYGKAGVGNPRSGWTPDLFKESQVIWSWKEPRTKNQEPGLVRAQLYGYPQNYLPNNKSAVRFPPLAAVGGGLSNHKHQRPRTGDIFGIFFPEKGRIAHVGFIDQWDGTWLITVEGNTNVSGSRDGDGVHRKRRLVKSVYKVARYIH